MLAGVSFDLHEGELLVVLGPSGSGKTTLLRLLAGLETPEAGEIELLGQEATSLPPQRRGFGIVFQEQALFTRMTVEQNVAFGLELRGVAPGDVRRRVDRMLDLVELGADRRKYPYQLSGGMRQRVAVARALAIRPLAMLFDEPFSGLDAITRAELRREVRAVLQSARMPALFITHDQEEALELADRIAILHDGRIEQIGTPFDVYNRPRTEFVARFLGAANVLLGRWREGEVTIGPLRLGPPGDAPALEQRQAVKVVFRPEDVAHGQLRVPGPRRGGRGHRERVATPDAASVLTRRWRATSTRASRPPRICLCRDRVQRGPPAFGRIVLPRREPPGDVPAGREPLAETSPR